MGCTSTKNKVNPGKQPDIEHIKRYPDFIVPVIAPRNDEQNDAYYSHEII